MAYIYFQLPLMVLLILPAFAGIKKEWRESAQSLGANTFQFWRYIGMPVLMPSLIAGVTLLFANAFGAYATAYTLVEAKLSLVTLQIGYMIAGEVRKDPAIGMAMAVVSLVIMGLSIGIYQAATMPRTPLVEILNSFIREWGNRTLMKNRQKPSRGYGYEDPAGRLANHLPSPSSFSTCSCPLSPPMSFQ